MRTARTAPSTSTDDVDLGAALELLIVQVNRLETVMHELRAAIEQRQAPVDPEADTRFVGDLALVFGQAAFNASDVRRASISDASARAIGVRLKRLRGQAVNGYVVQRIGRDEAGALWALTLYQASVIQPLDTLRRRGAR